MSDNRVNSRKSRKNENENKTDTISSQTKIVKISPIQKLKRSIRKIKLANRFLESTYGSVKINTEMDLYKDKYMGVLEVYFKTAKECYKWKFITGFILSFVEILRLSMKVPDFPVIKYSFMLLSTVCHYFKDSRNAIYSINRLIGFWDEQNDLETVIYGFKILAGVYNDK